MMFLSLSADVARDHAVGRDGHDPLQFGGRAADASTAVAEVGRAIASVASPRSSPTRCGGGGLTRLASSLVALHLYQRRSRPYLCATMRIPP
jgi:hypothetical protein